MSLILFLLALFLLVSACFFLFYKPVQFNASGLQESARPTRKTA